MDAKLVATLFIVAFVGVYCKPAGDPGKADDVTILSDAEYFGILKKEVVALNEQVAHFKDVMKEKRKAAELVVKDEPAKDLLSLEDSLKEAVAEDELTKEAGALVKQSADVEKKAMEDALAMEESIRAAEEKFHDEQAKKDAESPSPSLDDELTIVEDNTQNDGTESEFLDEENAAKVIDDANFLYEDENDETPETAQTSMSSHNNDVDPTETDKKNGENDETPETAQTSMSSHNNDVDPTETDSKNANVESDEFPSDEVPVQEDAAFLEGNDFDEYDVVLADKKKAEALKEDADEIDRRFVDDFLMNDFETPAEKKDAPEPKADAKPKNEQKHADRPINTVLHVKDAEIVHPEVLDEEAEKMDADAAEVNFLLNGIKSDLSQVTKNIKDMKDAYHSVKNIKLDERTHLKFDTVKLNLETVMDEFKEIKGQFGEKTEVNDESESQFTAAEAKNLLSDMKAQMKDVIKNVKDIQAEVEKKKAGEMKDAVDAHEDEKTLQDIKAEFKSVLDDMKAVKDDLKRVKDDPKQKRDAEIKAADRLKEVKAQLDSIRDSVKDLKMKRVVA